MFRLDKLDWDWELLARHGLAELGLPKVGSSGRVIGRVIDRAAEVSGLAAGTPVAVAGHDHIAAAFGLGVTTSGKVLDSMGTAESLVGSFPARRLTEADRQAGFGIGRHSAEGMMYWMGGANTSGGSLEWLGRLTGGADSNYVRLAALSKQLPERPGGLLYFPYLAGSASPHSDPGLRGALIGLDAAHGPADLLLAILEGTAYEVEYMRRRAEAMTGQPIQEMIVTGGGTRLPEWLQIKADVTGSRLVIPGIAQATLLGAALLAGVGAGVFVSQEQALQTVARIPRRVVEPLAEAHLRYQDAFETRWLPLLEPLSRNSRARGSGLKTVKTD
jgi:sugar (pentulose or hexulose) kinase